MLVRLVALALAVLVGASGLVLEDGCTPAERAAAVADAKKLAPAVVDSGCVALELVTDDSAVKRLCVYAEDLARLPEVVPNPDRTTEGAPIALTLRLHVSRTPHHHHCVRIDAGPELDAGADGRPSAVPAPASARDGGPAP